MDSCAAPISQAIGLVAASMLTVTQAQSGSLGSADRLALLVGSARARVLRAAEHRRTTDDVARELLLAPSTASEHLKLLAAAGVIARTRAGRRVYYEQTELGRRLIELLAPPPAEGADAPTQGGRST